MNTDEITNAIADELKSYIRERFGTLSGGRHVPDENAACILEAVAEWHGLEWCDSPTLLGAPDIRPLNDAFQDNERQTEAMVLLYALVEDWVEWPEERRERFVGRVILRTTRELVSPALRLKGRDDLAELVDAIVNAETDADNLMSIGDVLSPEALARNVVRGVKALARRDFDEAAGWAAEAAYFVASESDEREDLAERAASIWITSAKAARR